MRDDYVAMMAALPADASIIDYLTQFATSIDTVAWLDFALGLGSRVSFTQDYFDGHDATILVRHDEG